MLLCIIYFIPAGQPLVGCVSKPGSVFGVVAFFMVASVVTDLHLSLSQLSGVLPAK